VKIGRGSPDTVANTTSVFVMRGDGETYRKILNIDAAFKLLQTWQCRQIRPKQGSLAFRRLRPSSRGITTWDPEIFLQLLPKIGPRHVPFEEGSFIHLKEKGADSLCISLQSCLALAKLKSDPERERLELLPGRFRLSPAPLFSCHFLRS